VTLTPHPLLVPWSWKSRVIPIIPLWAVRPVQSFSACTREHFTFFYCLRDDLIILLPEQSDIQGDSKRWTQFRTSVFPELYMVCEWSI